MSRDELLLFQLNRNILFQINIKEDFGIGNKKIILLKEPIKPTNLKIIITKAAISMFGAIKFSAYDGEKCKLVIKKDADNE